MVEHVPVATSWVHDAGVAVARCRAGYLAEPPFAPSNVYPEFGSVETRARENPAFGVIRNLFLHLGLDRERFDTPDWNPLGALVRPGDRVLLKPNLIREGHQVTGEMVQVVTHGSVIRAVLDYVFLAGGRSVHVTVADGPQTDSDFDQICQRTGLDVLQTFYRLRGYDLSVLDLRRDRWFEVGEVIERREPLPGDPAGYTSVGLDAASEFESYGLSGRFYGADYDVAETRGFHHPGHHSYVLCRTAMDADVVINLPKLKTHKKVGVTLSLKNFVGINGYRNCLPHYTLGTPDAGGDEFARSDLSTRLQSRAIAAFKRALVARAGSGGSVFRVLRRGGRLAFGDTQRVVRSGNWHGNDTCWRMVLDLNKAFFYHDGAGRRTDGARRYMTIVDGIIGGDGNGPVAPDARPSGVLIGGFNPLAVDTVCATIMGFDYRRIPMLARGWEIRNLPLAAYSPGEIRIVSDHPAWSGSLANLLRAEHLGFAPHFGWVGAIERSAGVPQTV